MTTTMMIMTMMMTMTMMMKKIITMGMMTRGLAQSSNYNIALSSA
jgi:hypothetical protein